jgi:hypothetical protein
MSAALETSWNPLLLAPRYVKGYISHKNKVMVVAKNEPFPPLSSISFADA